MQTTHPRPWEVIGYKPANFNELVPELIKRLRFCFQADDGTIYWYEGTIKLLFEIMPYAIGTDILTESSQEKQPL